MVHSDGQQRDANQSREHGTPKVNVCFTDGAWVDRWNGGIGVLIYSKGELLVYKSAAARGCSALTLEALALKEALILAQNLDIEECTFFSDCLELVKAVSNTSLPSETTGEPSMWSFKCGKYLVKILPSNAAISVEARMTWRMDWQKKAGYRDGIILGIRFLFLRNEESRLCCFS